MYPVQVDLVELLDDASMSLLWSYDGLDTNEKVRTKLYGILYAWLRFVASWLSKVHIKCTGSIYEIRKDCI